MDRKKLLKHLVFLMFFLFLTDFIARELYWYYSISWFDIVMHFLSGLWVGLFFIYVFYVRKQVLRPLFHVILFVLFIGILYEIFEIYTQNYMARIPFNTFDTLSDLFFDLLGGSLAVFFLSRHAAPALENTV